MLTVLDDATTRLLYAQLMAAKRTETAMTALGATFETSGLPMTLSTDQTGWALVTRPAGGRQAGPDLLS